MCIKSRISCIACGILLSVSVLQGCYSDFDLVKNGIVAVGSNLFLVVDSTRNELAINTTQPGVLIPTHRPYQGKPRTETEIVRYDKRSKVVTLLTKLEKPTPGTVIIEFRPKYIKVYDGDGEQPFTKHSRQPTRTPLKGPA